MRYRLLIVFILFLFVQFGGYSQQSNVGFKELLEQGEQKIESGKFDEKLLCDLVVNKLNAYRNYRYDLEDLIPDTLLEKAATDQSRFMLNWQSETLKGPFRYKTTGKRLKYNGGSVIAAEVVKKVSTAKSSGPLSYNEVADEVIFKWFASKKYESVLTDPIWVLCGCAATLEEDGRKAYVSVVLGNYRSYNTGKELRSMMDIPYSKRKRGLKPYDKNECKRCDRFKNIESLVEGIYLEDGEIRLRYDNLKTLKKLFKDKRDGIAIDIVQKRQFGCDTANIVDNNLVNKGIMLKMVKSQKLFEMNRIPGRRPDSINTYLGRFPENLSDSCEINLLIIQNKKVCRTLTPVFFRTGKSGNADTIEMLADTVTIQETEYKPVATNSSVQFKIPFEAAKSEFKREDIEPFLALLKEPDFIIDELSITAYSSIEGTDEINRRIQNERAKSIVNALRERQRSDFITNVYSDYNIADFNSDIALTPYSYLAGKQVSEIQEEILEKKLAKKLEPLLSRHRYALIEMKITYDIEGEKEQAFVLKRFNDEVAMSNFPAALAIQKYIFRKVLEGEYDSFAVMGQMIPQRSYPGSETLLSGLLMNKLWLEKFINQGEADINFCGKVNAYNLLAPDNVYILFNRLLCNVMHDEFADENGLRKMAGEIEGLYESVLSQKTVDELNLRFRFKVIQAVDTLGKESVIVPESLSRIKDIVNLKENSCTNALKLAYIFIDNEDRDFACRLIEPFIKSEEATEELLVTYISLCTYFESRIQSARFAKAIKRISSEYPETFCRLMKNHEISFQVLVNPDVKSVYCDVCQ